MEICKIKKIIKKMEIKLMGCNKRIVKNDFNKFYLNVFFINYFLIIFQIENKYLRIFLIWMGI